MKTITLIFICISIMISCKKDNHQIPSNTVINNNKNVSIIESSKADSVQTVFKFASNKIPQIRIYAMVKNGLSFTVKDTLLSKNSMVSFYGLKDCQYSATLYVVNDTVHIQKFVNGTLICQDKAWQSAFVNCK